MKISVVIPTYKRPELLIKCLTALSNQDLDHWDFEIIVVSDGPDYHSWQMVSEWSRHVHLNLSFFQMATKKGPAAARNKGWRKAKSELIAFTDDDCEPDRCWLQSLISGYGQEDYIAFSGKTIVPLPENPTDFAYNTAHLQQAEFITANCACTKQSLIRTGGFDERFKMAWREDSDLQFQLLKNSIEVIKNQQAIVVHPVRNAPWGISIKEQKKGIYDALLFKKHPLIYREKIERQPNWNYYLTLALWLLLMVAVLVNSVPAMLITAATLICFIVTFFYKRIKDTRHSISHLTEMAFTSIVIPFLSVFWRIYGAVKFRVLYF